MKIKNIFSTLILFAVLSVSTAMPAQAQPTCLYAVELAIYNADSTPHSGWVQLYFDEGDGFGSPQLTFFWQGSQYNNGIWGGTFVYEEGSVKAGLFDNVVVTPLPCMSSYNPVQQLSITLPY